jgi:hypothetical protein
VERRQQVLDAASEAVEGGDSDSMECTAPGTFHQVL